MNRQATLRRVFQYQEHSAITLHSEPLPSLTRLCHRAIVHPIRVKVDDKKSF